MGSPYRRATYRDTPLLALLLAPNEWLTPSFGKYLFAACDIGAGVLMWRMLVNTPSQSRSATTSITRAPGTSTSVRLTFSHECIAKRALPAGTRYIQSLSESQARPLTVDSGCQRPAHQGRDFSSAALPLKRAVRAMGTCDHGGSLAHTSQSLISLFIRRRFVLCIRKSMLLNFPTQWSEVDAYWH